MAVGAINSAEPKTKTSNLNWELAGVNAGISAAAGGILGATVVAPPKVKSVEALYDNNDMFTSTMAKIDKNSSELAQSVKVHLTTIKNNEAERIKIWNAVFPNETITPSEYMTFVHDQKMKLAAIDEALEKYYNELSGMKGQQTSLDEIVEIGKKYGMLGNEYDKLDSNIMSKKVKVDEEVIKIWKKAAEQNVEVLQKTLEITQSGISLEKDGKILKSELLEYYKKSFKEADKAFLKLEEKRSFNALRRFIPKNRLKGALTVGGIAALLSGIVGLCSPKKDN